MEAEFARHFLISYEGGINAGKYDGQGVVEYQNGNVYEGSLQGGKMSGEGKLKWMDGIVYEGHIAQNVINGKGCYSWPDGSTYRGAILQGKREGYGVWTKRDVCYEGEWHQGLKHGTGTCYYNEDRSSFYSGDWVKGKKHGWGTMVYESGNRYEGQWENNVKCGEGQMVWITEPASNNELQLTCTLKSIATTGTVQSASKPPTAAELSSAAQQLGHRARHERYSGEWKDGRPHGYGLYEWLSIPKESSSPQNVDEAPYQVENVYKGLFKEGKKHGDGVCYFADGSVYEGKWIEDKKHGEGLRWYLDGRVDSVLFDNDMIHSVVAVNTNPGVVPSDATSKWAGPRLDPLLATTTSKGPSIVSVDNLPLDVMQFVESEKEAREIKCLLHRMFAHLRYLYKFYAKIATTPNPDAAKATIDQPLPAPIVPPTSVFEHPYVFKIPDPPSPLDIPSSLPAKTSSQLDGVEIDEGENSARATETAETDAPPPPLEVPEVESPSKEGLGRSFKHFVTPLNTVKSFSINDKKQLMEVPPRVSQCLTLAQFWEFLRDSRVTNRDLTLAKINRIILPALQGQTYGKDDDPKSEIVGELPEMQVRSSSKGGSPVESAMFSPKSALSSMQDPMSGVSGGKISGRPNAVEVPKGEGGTLEAPAQDLSPGRRGSKSIAHRSARSTSSDAVAVTVAPDGKPITRKDSKDSKDMKEPVSKSDPAAGRVGTPKSNNPDSKQPSARSVGIKSDKSSNLMSDQTGASKSVETSQEPSSGRAAAVGSPSGSPRSGKGKKGKGKSKAATEVIEEPPVDIPAHSPEKDPGESLVAVSQKKRTNPHDGSAQILFPTFVECIVRIAFHKFNFTGGHIWSTVCEQARLLNNLQQMFQNHICFLTDSINALAGAGIPGLIGFAGEPTANITNEAPKAKPQKRKARPPPGTRATTSSQAGEPPSPDPGGVTPMADRAAAYGHYGKSGSNFFGSQHFGTASSFHHDGSLHEATPLPPDDFRGQTATTQGLTTGGGGSTRFGAETGGGLHTMASARSMANTAPATGATAGAADGVHAQEKPNTTTSVSVVSIAMEDQTNPSVCANLTVVEATQTTSPSPTPTQDPTKQGKAVGRMHRLYAQDPAEGPHGKMSFLGLDLQYKGDILGPPAPGQEPSKTHCAMVRQQIKTVPVRELLETRGHLLRGVWYEYLKRPQDSTITLRFFLKFLSDYLLIPPHEPAADLPKKDPPKKAAAAKAPKPATLGPFAVPLDKVSPRPEKGSQSGGKSPKKPAEKGEEVEEAKEAKEAKIDLRPKKPPINLPDPDTLLRRPKITSLMHRIVYEVFEEDAEARITDNPDYTDPLPVREPPDTACSAPNNAGDRLQTPAFSSVEIGSVISNDINDYDFGGPVSPRSGPSTSASTRLTRSDGEEVEESQPHSPDKTTEPEDGFEVRDSLTPPDNVAQPKPAEPVKPSALEIKRVLAMASRMKTFASNWDYIYADLEMLYPQFIEAICIVAATQFPREKPVRPTPLNIHSAPGFATFDLVPSNASTPAASESPSPPGKYAVAPSGTDAAYDEAINVTILRDRLAGLLDWIEEPPRRRRPRTPSPPPIRIPPPLPRKKPKVPLDADPNAKGKGGKAAKPAAGGKANTPAAKKK